MPESQVPDESIDSRAHPELCAIEAAAASTAQHCDGTLGVQPVEFPADSAQPQAPTPEHFTVRQLADPGQ